MRKETSEKDILNSGAEASSDLEESFNAMKDGYGVGSKFFGTYGGIAGAAIALWGTKAAEKFADNAREMGIDPSDSTTISGINHANTLSHNKKTSSRPHSQAKVSGTPTGKCTPSTQPRTSDGRFASCGHSK